FETKVGISDAVPVGSATPLTFQVVGDDKVLWSSKTIQDKGDTQDCRVPVQGIHVLELRVVCPGWQGWAHAVWLDPYILSKKRQTPRAPPTREKAEQPPGPTKPAGEPARGLRALGRQHFTVISGQWNVKGEEL